MEPMTTIAFLTSLAALGVWATLKPASPAPQAAQTVPAWPFVLATGAGIGLTWAVVSFLPWLAPILSAGTLIPVF